MELFNYRIKKTAGEACQGELRVSCMCFRKGGNDRGRHFTLGEMLKLCKMGNGEKIREDRMCKEGMEWRRRER